LIERKLELLSAAEAWFAAHPTIDDDETQGVATENRRMIRSLAKLAKDRHGEQKAPFLQGGRAVDGWFAQFGTAIGAADNAYTTLMNSYATKLFEAAEAKRKAEAAEAQRVADEKAEVAAKALAEKPPEQAEEALQVAATAAEIAEQAAAPVNAAAATRTRGDYGAVSSLKTKWRWRVVDENKVPRRFMSVDSDKINAEFRRHGKDASGKPLGEIPGILVYPDRST
jgi:hypothetical protein